MVCLLGGNASGKTTTLKTILGYVTPSEGEVLLDGDVVSGMPTIEVVRRGVSMVPENRRLFADMTVSENLDLGAYQRRDRAGIAEDRERLMGVFPRVRERLKQKAGTLSGGEQQMVAMCRALMAKPKVLLMDEPSMGLAPVLVDQVFEIIKQIRALGTTIFVVEQNANMALSIADRGYVIQTGEVVLADTAPEPVGQPVDAGGVPRGAVMLLLDAAEVRRRLSMSSAIDALEAGFDAQDPSVSPPRSHVETPAGSLLLMPAFGEGGVGVKLVTLTPDNPKRRLPFIDAVYVLFDAATADRRGDHGRSRAHDAAYRGGVRAGDTSSGQPGCRTAGDLRRWGAGARTPGGDARRPADRARHRRIANAAASESAREAARELGVAAEVGGVQDVARGRPRLHVHDQRRAAVRRRSLLAPGAHVNAVGSYRPTARELDAATLPARARRRRDAGGCVRRSRRAVHPDRRGRVRA